MDQATLIAGMEFARGRTLGILKTIESSGQDVQKVLSWRPANGRAHIAWQAMHCAATHDRYFNVRIKGGQARNEALVTNFAGGSIPSDKDIPTLAEIRQKLETSFADALATVRGLSAADMATVQDLPNNARRSIGESITLLIWHEAHHQGQIHLTWNLYKQAYGLK